jgi:hypothetical protein
MSISTNGRITASTRTALRPRYLAALLVALGSLVTATLPAHAAPPANDSISTPVSVGTLPRTYVQDTSEATSSPTDGRCVFGSSVWYRYRPTTTARRKLVTIGSDYDTVLALFRGPRNSRTFIKCNDDAADLAAALVHRFEAGRTYWIAVSACCSRAARGGNAVLNLYRGGAALDYTVSVDAVASGDVSGRAIVSGSATCSLPAVVHVFVQVSQRVDGHVARGWGDGAVPACDADGESWTAIIDSETGWAFQPGPAMVSTWSDATDGFVYLNRAAEPTVVQLTSAPNARQAH